MSAFIDRTGEIGESRVCGPMVIVEYSGHKNIIVKFQTGSLVKTSYHHFKKGGVKDPLFPSRYGFGFLGVGVHASSEGYKTERVYETWSHMLGRVYGGQDTNRTRSYEGTSICEEWGNFQTFGDWFVDNFYEVPGEVMELDKDIVKKGNKVYCPGMCSFVPKPINSLFNLYLNGRGGLPLGVCFNKSKQRYQAQITQDGIHKTLGYFDHPEKAFRVYKTAKEENIKRMAERYVQYLPSKVYNTLVNYEVEITD